MKPARFEYHRPETISEACELLEEYPDGELLAGNQSLGILMANRLAAPDHLIDLNRIEDLAYIEVDEDEIEIGAMTRHRDIEQSDALRTVAPVLPEGAEQIAGPSVRNRGTIGGSIGEADPAGNHQTALAALGGEIHLRSVDGSRTVPVEEYFIAYMFTDRRENELIEAVSAPREPFPPDRTGMAFLELKKAAQTWPTLSAATAVRVDDPGADAPVVEEARVALANAADVPLRVPEAEAAVEGTSCTEAALEAAEAAAVEAADPQGGGPEEDDEFREEVAGVYTRRSLATSYGRAVEPAGDAQGDRRAPDTA